MTIRESGPVRAWATILLTLAFTAAASAQVTLGEIEKRGHIRVAVANEIPYGYMDSRGNAMGAGPDVARLVLERMGIREIRWVATSFDSLIPGLRSGRFDMAAAEQAILPERCQQIDYAEVPNTSYGEGLLVAAGNPEDLHGYEDFVRYGDLKVAVMAGANQLDMMQALGVEQSRIVTIGNNVDAVSTVASGRAAAYAATSLTAANLAKKSDSVELAEPFRDPIVDGRTVRSWGGFAFHPGSDELRRAFSEELKAVKRTEEWRRILRRHGFTQADIEGSFTYTTEELCTGEGI